MPKSKDRMAINYPQIAARVFNTPLLIEEGKFHAILSVLAPRMGFDLGFEVEPGVLHYADAEFRHVEYMAQLESQGMSTKYVEDGGYYLVDGKTALIPIIGTLVQRSDFMDEMSGMTSYSKVQRKFDAAMNDKKVKSIVLELDTPGGEVAGAFDMADHIYQSRGEKPIIAVASEKAASAGYLIASAADEVVLPRTGNVGSIGVVASHYDMGRAMEKKGIAVTLLYAGEKKIDGHPFGPLDDRVKEEWMAEIADVYSLFTSTVSRNLDVGEDRIRGTQAGMFMGMKAVDAGLAHRVNTLSNELANASLRVGRGQLNDRLRSSASSPPQQENQMSGNQQQGGQGTVSADDVTRAREEGRQAGLTEAKAANQQAVDAARLEGANAERERIKTVLAHAESEGREQFARHLAFDTAMAADEAGKMLAAAPKDGTKEAAGSPLERAMSRAGTPGVRGQEATEQRQGAPALNPSDVYNRRAKQAESYRR